MNESANLIVPLRELSAYIFKCRSKLEEALELFLYSIFIFIVLNILIYYVVHNYRNGRSKFRFCRATKLPENVSRVLLVTAHPDDECMFFAPSLICKLIPILYGTDNEYNFLQRLVKRTSVEYLCCAYLEVSLI